MRSLIVGTGSYAPSRVLKNAELEKMVDTTDQWIVERTGIRARHFAAPDVTSSELGVRAARIYPTAHSFPVTAEVSGPLLRALQEARIPLFVDVAQLEHGHAGSSDSAWRSAQSRRTGPPWHKLARP